MIGFLIAGLIIGALARLIMPGRQRIGLLWTLLLGVAGSVIGGVIAMDVVHQLTGIAAPATLGTALIVDLRDMRVDREPVLRGADCDRCCTSGAERP